MPRSLRAFSPAQIKRRSPLGECHCDKVSDYDPSWMAKFGVTGEE